MKRAVIKMEDGFCNLEADTMETEGEYISIYNGKNLVGVFDIDYIRAAYVSEKTTEGA